jgi:hypothetical protein
MPVAPVASSFGVNSAALTEALELVDFASRCHPIMYCFELTDRGQYEVRYERLERRTVFSYASLDESATDTLLRTH